jgi:hypothetical protein
MYILFYRQAIEFEGRYASDMKAYILEILGQDSGYEFPYPLLFWLSRLWMVVLSPEASIALSVTLLNGLSVAAVYYYTNIELKSVFRGKQIWFQTICQIGVIFLVFSLFFVSMVYAPKFVKFHGFDVVYRCMGEYTPNPYWNATFLATRPFSIFCFFEGAKLLGEYEQNFRLKSAVAVGIWLFLTTFTKPSFTFVFVPVLGLILVYRLIRSHFTIWKQTCYIILCALPTGILLLYQFQDIFVKTTAIDESGIGFAIGKAWGLYSFNIPLSIFQAMVFPLMVLVLNLGELRKNGTFRLAWQIFLVGFLTFLCLYEKGFRFPHVNFSWGYMHGLFFVFLVSLIWMIKNAVQWKFILLKFLVLPEVWAYVWQLRCGIGYFIYIFTGNDSGGF